MTIRSAARAIEAFPFAALPTVERADLAARAALRSSATGLSCAELLRVLGELSGEVVGIAVTATRAFDLSRVGADSVGVAFAPADEPGLVHGMLVEVELALANVLVTKALRQRAPQVTDTSDGVKAPVAGALAAVVHAALRRAHTRTAFRVAAAGPGGVLARDLADAHRRIATAWLRVTIGSAAFDARVSVPMADRSASERSGLSRTELAALGDMPIALPLVVASWTARRADLDALRVGDAVVAPSFPLELSAEEQLLGPIALVPSTSERGIVGALAAGGRLVLRTEHAGSHPWDRLRWSNEEPAMSAETNATLEVLEDAPVIVRVELGAVEMKAHEWASLSSGDVFTLGRKLGDPAVLRVGGVEVGRGELVQVEGEYGVRILARGRK